MILVQTHKLSYLIIFAGEISIQMQLLFLPECSTIIHVPSFRTFADIKQITSDCLHENHVYSSYCAYTIILIELVIHYILLSFLHYRVFDICRLKTIIPEVTVFTHAAK